MKKAILAGGCFWCSEAIFQRLKGVDKITPGFTGGNIKNPAYREVCTGRTGHAEAVEIFYNENEVSFATLLEVFFTTHDPTTLNRQGADVGTEYRSEIFYTSEPQKQTAVAFVKELTATHFFSEPIVTKITPFDVFYKADKDHHNYYNQNSEQQYCDFTIKPKLAKLKEMFSGKLK